MLTSYLNQDIQGLRMKPSTLPEWLMGDLNTNRKTRNEKFSLVPLVRTCSELSESEFLSERLRVTMTEGLWSARPRSRWVQVAPSAGSSRFGEDSSLRTGTDTGITRGTRLSSRGLLVFKPSSVGLQGLCGSWWRRKGTRFGG